jgi:hypothetical protein
VATAALVATAAVVATAASLRTVWRATPATENGVRGKPMIASALPTNPNSATDRKTTATPNTVDSKNDFIDLLLPLKDNLTTEITKATKDSNIF